jgi:hypothetical protein
MFWDPDEAIATQISRAKVGTVEIQPVETMSRAPRIARPSRRCT